MPERDQRLRRVKEQLLVARLGLPRRADAVIEVDEVGTPERAARVVGGGAVAAEQSEAAVAGGRGHRSRAARAAQQRPARAPARALRTREFRVEPPTLAEFESHLGDLLARRTATGPVFRADGITVRFGGVTACDDVTIEVNDGEIVALIGPNGAGKTTLFNAVSGFTTPQSGRVRLRGRDISDLAAHDRARLGIARTFQQMRPFGTMTAVENLVTAQHLRLKSGFFACGLGLPLGRSEDRAAARRAMQILEFLDIAEYAERIASTLPYGVQRLIEIGRGLALDPTLLLLDEPAAGMGPDETQELEVRVRRMRDDMGITVFLIEHDIPFTMGLADYVYVLDFGAVISEGLPGVVRNDPAVKAAYLGQDSE